MQFSDAERAGFVQGLKKHADELDKLEAELWSGFEAGLKKTFLTE